MYKKLWPGWIQGCRPWLSKSIAASLICQHPLYTIAYAFNFSKAWTLSRNVPIHKKGDRSQASNYRSVAILSAIPKLFESLINSKLYDYIHPSIMQQQHGFLWVRYALTSARPLIKCSTFWGVLVLRRELKDSSDRTRKINVNMWA